MNKYELMVIYSSELKDAQVTEQISMLKKKIQDLKGELVSEDFWGLKNFAYKIRKHERGFYHVSHFFLPAINVKDLSTFLQHKEKEVLRSLITVAERN